MYSWLLEGISVSNLRALVTDIAALSLDNQCYIPSPIFVVRAWGQLRGRAYTRFLVDLRAYLADFLARTQPLVDLGEVRVHVQKLISSKSFTRC